VQCRATRDRNQTIVPTRTATQQLEPPEGFRGEWITQRDALGAYGEAAGILRAAPTAGAVPHSVHDVVALVRWAAVTGTPLVPRGAATGMPGGNVGAGVAIDLMTAFSAEPVIDPGRRSARIQPGITLSQLNRAAAPHGLHFPVDPSSGARCSLGGMIANNAAGARSVRHGATRAWVNALDLVLADGTVTTLRRRVRPTDERMREILATIDRAIEPDRQPVLAEWPRVRKNSSGYALREYLESGDAVDLLVGSEGTLALLVGAEVRLAPVPAERALALLEFTDLEAAGAAVARLLPLRPDTCEILDRTFLELVRDAGADSGYPLRPGLEAILLVEVSGDTPAAVARRLETLAEHVVGIADRVVTATDPEQQNRLWEVRRAASPLIAQRTDGRVSMQFIEDGVVPVDRLPEYIRALRSSLRSHGLPAVIFGHAGDGNLHVNPLVDVRAAGWRDSVESVILEVTRAVRALGGTMAGEHGDGRLRAPLLESIWGAQMVERFRTVKSAFDPAGILNPGVILPLPGQRPLDALRAYPG
jgi:FAD/FMN-containing dehydrogenase